MICTIGGVHNGLYVVFYLSHATLIIHLFVITVQNCSQAIHLYDWNNRKCKVLFGTNSRFSFCNIGGSIDPSDGYNQKDIYVLYRISMIKSVGSNIPLVIFPWLCAAVFVSCYFVGWSVYWDAFVSVSIVTAYSMRCFFMYQQLTDVQTSILNCVILWFAPFSAS